MEQDSTLVCIQLLVQCSAHLPSFQGSGPCCEPGEGAAPSPSTESQLGPLESPNPGAPEPPGLRAGVQSFLLPVKNNRTEPQEE